MKRMIYFFLLFILVLAACEFDALVRNSQLPIDNWVISTPEEQGLDGQILSHAFVKADQLEFVNSIIIVRNGYLVAEVYYNGWEANEAHNFKGTSTSVLSALVGIALREKYFNSLNQKMLDFFPEYVSPNLDRRKHNMVLTGTGQTGRNKRY